MITTSLQQFFFLLQNMFCFAHFPRPANERKHTCIVVMAFQHCKNKNSSRWLIFFQQQRSFFVDPYVSYIYIYIYMSLSFLTYTHIFSRTHSLLLSRFSLLSTHTHARSQVTAMF